MPEVSEDTLERRVLLERLALVQRIQEPPPSDAYKRLAKILPDLEELRILSLQMNWIEGNDLAGSLAAAVAGKLMSCPVDSEENKIGTRYLSGGMME